MGFLDNKKEEVVEDKDYEKHIVDTIPEETSVKVEVEPDWLSESKETILLYGLPKVGKTWAYCSMIEAKIKEGAEIYIINTDNGVAKTLKQYFSSNLSDVKSKFHYYFVGEIDDIFEIIPKVKASAKQKDVIIIDLLSDFWEMEQGRFMEELAGKNPIGFVIRATKDSAKFGLFEAQKWQYIKKIDNYVSDNLIIRPPSNLVVGVCAAKDIEVEKAITHSKDKKNKYDSAGMKPAGQPQLPYKFNTIVYFGTMDDKHYFQIMGDRGTITKPTMITYERDWCAKFLAEREKQYK